MFKSLRHQLGMHLYRRRCRLWIQQKTHSSEVQTKTRQGEYIVSTADDIIGASLFTSKQYELQWMKEAVRILKQRGCLTDNDNILVDVGANIGITSIPMLGLGFSYAIAVEADPENFSRLSRNVSLNRMAGRIECVNAAATEAEGEYTLNLTEANLGGHHIDVNAPIASRKGATVRILGRKLDEIVKSSRYGASVRAQNSLLWLDVEGHETKVLKGATELLLRKLPLCIEINPFALETWGEGCAVLADLLGKFWKEAIVVDGLGMKSLGAADCVDYVAGGGKELGKYANAILLPE